MTSATDFLNSNFFTGEGLDRNVRIETKIVSTRSREFEDGLKLVVYTDYLGKGVVYNQTKLKATIAAWGANLDNWIGKTIIISRGTALFSGKPMASVEVEPVVPERIATEQRPSLEEPRRGSIDIRSGKGAWNDPAPPIDRVPDGPDAPDDDMPF
jgi:hypothetical protein